MGFLRDEILRTMILSDRKSRHACAGSRERIEPGTVAEHVAKVQSIGFGKVVVHPDPELIGIVVQRFRSIEDVRAAIRLRKEAEKALGERVYEWKLVIRDGRVREDIEELMRRVIAHPVAVKTFGA